jgi:hypothetical protein
MKLQYTDATNATIQATLDEGEALGNHAGPAVIHVPTDPANTEYAEIMEEGYQIEPYAPPPPPVPTQVGHTQWYHEAARIGLISENEALDEAMSGNIPASLEPYIAKVPAAKQFDVRMLLKGTIFDRTAPTCSIWIEALGWDNATSEQFWTDASLIT